MPDQQYTEAQFRSMTQALRLLFPDEQVGSYIKWIIQSDLAKEHYNQTINPEKSTL